MAVFPQTSDDDDISFVLCGDAVQSEIQKCFILFEIRGRSACIVAALLITQIIHRISFTSVIGSMILYKHVVGIFNCKIDVKSGLGCSLIRSLESQEVHSNQAISHLKYYQKDKQNYLC